MSTVFKLSVAIFGLQFYVKLVSVHCDLVCFLILEINTLIVCMFHFLSSFIYLKKFWVLQIVRLETHLLHT